MIEATPSANSESTLEGPRPARVSERSELLAMINFIFRVSSGRPATIATDWAHVYDPANLANVNVVCNHALQDDGGRGSGQLVASTGLWVSDVAIPNIRPNIRRVEGAGSAARLRVGGINCVGTLPEYRRHGLGEQLMAAAQQRMQQLGCHIGLLSTGITNWYRRFGWEEAGIKRTYRINRGNVGCLPTLPQQHQVRIIEIPVGPEARADVITSALAEAIDAPLLDLYHAHRFGAERTMDRFRQLVEARSFDRLVVLQKSDAPPQSEKLAYLLVCGNTVFEWGGAAESIAGVLRATFESLDDPNARTSQRQRDPGPRPFHQLLIESPAWSHPVTTLLESLGLPCNTGYLGMIYLAEPQAVLDAYGVRGVEIEARGGEDFILHAHAEMISLTRRQLTKLLFGPERIRFSGEALFPLPFWQWYLEMV